MTQQLESEVSLMCNLSKGVEEKGIAKGIEQGRIETLLGSIKNLMQNLGLGIEEAMSALNIPEEERPKVLELLH